MIFQEKELKLKEGRTALLRAPTPDDAEEMIRYLRTVNGETPFLTSYPEEVTFTVEGERGFLTSINDSPNDMMIVASVDGEIAGNCHIAFRSHIKDRHRATVMIGLYQKFWNLGIGSALFREMIAAAEARGTEQLELQVMKGNDRAVALYRKMGFAEAAVLPNAFKLKDGRTLDEITMIRKVGK